MPIFISYSHKDKDFVDALAMQLVVKNVNIWIDRWELSVGDSLIDKVQEAVDGASALLVVLSKASTQSEWCKKELSSGLLRELEEKRVVVMPVMLEDCEVPIFARGKMYADFRTDFDAGLKAVVEGIAKVTNSAMARSKEPTYNTDWSMDWRISDGALTITITYLQIPSVFPYSCLVIVDIAGNETASALFMRTSAERHPDFGKLHVVQMLLAHFEKFGEFRVLLSDEFAKQRMFEFGGNADDEMYVVRVMSRRLGEDTGKDVLMNISGLIKDTYQHMSAVLRGAD